MAEAEAKVFLILTDSAQSQEYKSEVCDFYMAMSIKTQLDSNIHLNSEL